MDTEMSEVPYVIVFKGCDPKSADAIEKILLKAIEEVIAEGIPASLLEAAIHQLELSRLEITGDHSPFGLTLFMRSAHSPDIMDAIPKTHYLSNPCLKNFSL